MRRRASLPSVSLEEALDAAAAGYAKSSRSAATWRAYEAGWKVFLEWCESVKLNPLPATSYIVALFFAAEAKLRRAPSTLGRRLSAIRLMHLGAKLPSPHDALEVAEVLRGIRRRWKRPPAQKVPALDEDIKRMADAVEPQNLKGLWDRALLLLGFAGALRRSELVALNTDHLIERDEGFAVRIASSKRTRRVRARWSRFPASRARPTARYAPSPTGWSWRRNQPGSGVPTTPSWDKVGRSHLSAPSVALVVKELASKVGLDAGRYAGHSLRSGFLTSAARNRASIFKMADQSRLKSLDVLPTSGIRSDLRITRLRDYCNERTLIGESSACISPWTIRRGPETNPSAYFAALERRQDHLDRDGLSIMEVCGRRTACQVD